MKRQPCRHSERHTFIHYFTHPLVIYSLIICLFVSAGKTTLMNALAGKAGYGRRTGEIEVNGQADSLERYTRVMGFVPQVGSSPLSVQWGT